MMKMKFSNILFITAGLLPFLLVSCNEKQEIDYNIVPGNTLYAPETGTEIDLTTGVTTTFEWAPSVAEDNGYVGYEVIFDTADGDFSDPVATYVSALTGSETNLSLSASELNIVAGNAGIEVAGTGTLKWTVRASKGIRGSVYTQINEFTVTRQNSMSPLPEAVTLAGAATEDPENGIQMVASLGINDEADLDGTFECFTRLTSGEFTVVDDLGRYYRLNSDGSITNTDNAESSEVPDGDGIYWLKLAFDGMTWQYAKVDRIEFYGAAWADNSMSTARQDMVYEGRGVWFLENYENTVSLNSANDTRHRFNMYLSSGTLVDEYGTDFGIGITDGQGLGSEYTTDYLKAHIYTRSGVGNWDWDRTWNFLLDDCGVPFDCRLYLNSDNEAGTYWHEYYFHR